MSDFYKILEVEKNATKDEIKQAFRKKARLCHPDVSKDPNAEEQFKELGKAYETLMDDDKRALYDRYGEDGLKNAGYSTSGPFDFGFGDLNDIFESFFGGFGGFQTSQQNPNAPQQGSDLRLDIRLEFEEAVFGVEKQVKIDHLEICDECSGSGAQAGTKKSTCKTCNGAGKVQQVTQTILGSFAQVGICPTCQGKGQTIDTPCKKCNGNGRVEKEKTITVKIPAGVDNGSKIRIAHEGDAGKNGGKNGDLFIVLYVKEHEYYKRDGVNIYSEFEISTPQAVLGDEVEIKTLDGAKTLTVPSGIESGKVLTMKSLGVPFLGHKNKRGDHFVIVKIKTPTNLNEEEKKLYARLFEISQSRKSGETFIDKVKGVLHNN